MRSADEYRCNFLESAERNCKLGGKCVEACGVFGWWLKKRDPAKSRGTS